MFDVEVTAPQQMALWVDDCMAPFEMWILDEQDKDEPDWQLIAHAWQSMVRLQELSAALMGTRDLSTGDEHAGAVIFLLNAIDLGGVSSDKSASNIRKHLLPKLMP